MEGEGDDVTLQDATVVLSFNEHNGANGWRVERVTEEDETEQQYAVSPVPDEEYEFCLTEFEAIAVAEKYLRDAAGGR